MELMHAGLLLLLFCAAYSYQIRSGARHGLSMEDPELEWEKMETIMGKEVRAAAPETKIAKSASGNESSIPEAKRVPEYLIVSASMDHKEAFKPEKGARPLPEWAQEMLLLTAAAPSPAAGASPKLVEMLCHVDRMYVRIRREVFNTRDAYKYLKLGSCPVNQGTAEYYYFLYLLKADCGFQQESHTDFLYIRNVLHYKPAGLVLREMPFDIPLQCKYFRFFHSYETGFYPKLQGGTVFKALQTKSSFALIIQDASGNKITGTKTYTLGQPVYFEAKQLDSTLSSKGRRLYINKCFMTASQDPNSNPNYAVIDNQGCMIDAKMTQQSQFLTSASKMVQKFRVGASIFKDTASTSSQKQLYMHCSISVGKLAPTLSSKACNYDPTTKKWKELYGHDSVCTCCDSTCFLVKPKASRNVISSHSWKVDLSSKGGHVEVEPWKKTFAADPLSWEDPEMAEDGDFLNYWEHDS